MNICYCGTQAGYPHRDECPFPLFRGSPVDELRWEQARQDRARLLELDLSGDDPRAAALLSARIRRVRRLYVEAA